MVLFWTPVVLKDNKLRISAIQPSSSGTLPLTSPCSGHYAKNSSTFVFRKCRRAQIALIGSCIAEMLFIIIILPLRRSQKFETSNIKNR